MLEVVNLRAGLIGMGTMGRHHARVLSLIEGVDFIGVADPDPSVKLAAGIPVYASVEALLDAGLDYCVLAVPTAEHLHVALQLAEYGVHTLVEKPLAENSTGAKKIADAFESASLVGAVGHVERYNPALIQARDRIASGELGDLYQIATRRTGPFPERISDVGVVLDLATHDIDLTSWVAQAPYNSISAQSAHKSGRLHEDIIAAVGLLSNSVTTNHLVNWLSPLKERQTLIYGDRGTFQVDTLTGDLTFYQNGVVQTVWDDVSKFRGVTEGNVTRFAFPKVEPLLSEHIAFRDAIYGLSANIVTMRQGLETIAVAEAMLESARNSVTVNLRY